MFKHLGLITFLLSLCCWAEAQPQCLLKKMADGDISVTAGTRQIDIIGWVHLSQEDINVFRDGFNNAISSLEKKECFMAKNALASALTKNNQDLKSAQNVFKKLESLHSQKTLSYVGLEATHEEFQQNLGAARSIADGIKALQLNCGMMIAPETASLSLVIPGPEYAFSSAYQGMVMMRALEEETVKQDNARQVASRAGVKKVLSGIQLRNQAIAKNALGLEGHGAIVIGKMHVDGLAQEILKQCQTP